MTPAPSVLPSTSHLILSFCRLDAKKTKRQLVSCHCCYHAQHSLRVTLLKCFWFGIILAVVQQGLLVLSNRIFLLLLSWAGLACWWAGIPQTGVDHRLVFCEMVWFLLEMKSPKRHWIRLALLWGLCMLSYKAWQKCEGIVLTANNQQWISRAPWLRWKGTQT